MWKSRLCTYSDTFGPIAGFNPVMGYTIRPCNPSAADQNTYKELGGTLLLYKLAILRSHLVTLFSPYSTWQSRQDNGKNPAKGIWFYKNF